MKIVLVALLVAASLTVAAAQNAGGNQSSPNTSPSSDQGASAYGNNTYDAGAQTQPSAGMNADPTASSSAASPQKAEPNTQVPATPQANSGTPNGAAGATPAPPSPDDSAALQWRIQDALGNEPTLGASHVSVNVTDSAIELAGTVGSTKDKETADRIAKSFDGNRQLTDKLVVTGHGHSDLATGHPAMNNGGTGNAPNPAMNSGSSNPQR